MSGQTNSAKQRRIDCTWVTPSCCRSYLVDAVDDPGEEPPVHGLGERVSAVGGLRDGAVAPDVLPARRRHFRHERRAQVVRRNLQQRRHCARNRTSSANTLDVSCVVSLYKSISATSTGTGTQCDASQKCMDSATHRQLSCITAQRAVKQA